MRNIFFCIILFLKTALCHGEAFSDANIQFFKSVEVSKNMESTLVVEKTYQSLIDRNVEPIRCALRMASLTAVKARYVFWPFEKLSLADQAAKKFDLLEKNCNTPELKYEFHYFRGVTFAEYPAFLGKIDIALSDLNLAYRSSFQLKRNPIELGKLYLTLSKLYLQKKDQKNAFSFARRVVHTTSFEPHIKEAKQIITQN
jgi:hypothetical protein